MKRPKTSRLSLRLRLRALWWEVTAWVRYWPIAVCVVGFVAFPWVLSHLPWEGCPFPTFPLRICN